VGEGHDQRHVVLDDDDGQTEALVNRADEAGDLRRLLGVHPGCRLVQQQNRGFCRQCAGDLELALEPIRQRRGVDVGEARQPERLQMSVGALLEGTFLLQEARCREDSLPESRFSVELLGGLDVIQHRHPGK
jgi:hypothetical protein